VTRISSLLTSARQRAGLSQRTLAEQAGIPQASISRIESGRISPRATTLERWLAACGVTLEIRPAGGLGVDRTAIRERLAMTPSERHHLGVNEARAMLLLERARLRPRRPAR
jgi:transcriptional regulator with XRE-family HTH domain